MTATSTRTTREKWMSIPGYSRYEVSSHGNVRRSERIYNTAPGPCSQSINIGGYSCVSLTGDDGRNRKLTVHSLVLLAFVGPRPHGLQGCHDDDIKTNNTLGNLRYGTPAANTADMLRNGTQACGERHPKAKLTESLVREIYKRCAAGDDRQVIAEDCGVTTALVSNIARGRCWRHLKLPRLKAVRALSDEGVLRAARLHKQGTTKSEVARQLGISPALVHDALKRRLPKLVSGDNDLFELRGRA